jgi:hypothetical protein
MIMILDWASIVANVFQGIVGFVKNAPVKAGSLCFERPTEASFLPIGAPLGFA